MADADDVLYARQERIDELHRCRAGRTALLVIDMQRGSLEPGAALEVPQGRQIIENVRRVIELCRTRAIPVVHSQFVYATAIPCLRGDPFGPEHLPAGPSSFVGFGHPSSNCLVGPDAPHGANAAEIVPELAPRPGELVIAAHTYDKFYGTSLDLALRSQEIRFLLIAGVTTDICVNSTVLAAANRDYRVTVLMDGVATLWPEIQEACFDIWRRKFARLRTTAQMVEELSSLC